MPNTQPIFPGTVTVGIASLTAATPITSRTNITGTAGLTKLTDATTNGMRVDRIAVAAKGNTAAGAVDLWIFNSTTNISTYFDTIPISALTASTTAAPFVASKSYADLGLSPTLQLYVSETVAQDLNVYALGGSY